MRTFFTLLALLIISVLSVNAQIDGLDASKYYFIKLTRSSAAGHAIGVDNMHSLVDGALLQQQEPLGLPTHLWQIKKVTDSTYRFINQNSEMAIGITEWFGAPNPWVIPDDVATTTWDFVWGRNYYGVCQRPLDETATTQIWQPVEIGRSEAEDTVFYRITNIKYLEDSAFSWNLWRNDATLNYRNFALLDGKTREPGSYNDPRKGYSYYFEASFIDVPTTVSSNEVSKIQVFGKENGIMILGDIGARTIEVYSILGERIYIKEAQSTETIIYLNRGIYIVRIGNLSYKAVVR